MHILFALATLLLQPVLTVPTSDVRNNNSNSPLDATNTSSNGLIGSNSLPSPISLTFDLFGSQIPSSAVNAAFNGAITRIYPFLHNQPNDPITNNDFQYRAVGGSIQIGVTGVLNYRLSWQQLNSVLRQASSFMNGGLGASRQHMQELSFDIIKDGTKIGDGLVTYHPSRVIQFESSMLPNLTNSNDTGFLLPATDPSLKSKTADIIPFRIPDTPFTLMFDFLGHAIPILNVWAAFEGAHSEIASPLGEHSASHIPGGLFAYSKENLHITVLATGGIGITWKQLSWVLSGMFAFITGMPEHYQVLTCDIVFIGYGTLGYASLGYSPSRMEVKKRNLLNTTISLQLAPNISVFVPFHVPETNIIIDFKYLGKSIPSRQLDDAIWSALEQIGPSYREHGTNPIPSNQFFRALNGVRITIFANVPHVLSWIQLHDMIWGLLLFVTGAVRGEEQHRALSFDVDDIRAGKLAYGSLRYSAPKMADVQEAK